MSKLLKAEFYKLFHHKAFWGMLAFSLVLGSVLMLDGGVPDSAGSAFRSSLYNTPLLYFLPIIFCALFVGEEFENRGYQSYIAAGHGRGRILLAKTVSYLTSSALMLVGPAALHGLAGAAVFGAAGGPAAAGGNGAMPLAIVNGTVILAAVLAMGMLPLLCSFLFRDVGKSLAVPAAVFFLMIFVLNSGGAEEIALLLPMGQIRLLSLNQPGASGLPVIIVDIIWIAVLYAGAFLAFIRSDLK